MKNQMFLYRLGFALNGIKSAWKTEASFRFQCLAAVAVLIIAFILRASLQWFAIFSITIGIVLSVELLNTSLETLMDRVHPELHPTIKIAKDGAAGAVLISSIISVCVFVAFLVDRYG